jgi:hypothetical protein
MPKKEPEIKSEIEVSGAAIARMFSVHPLTVARWRREGLKCSCFGPKLLRYRPSEVRRWLESRGGGRRFRCFFPSSGMDAGIWRVRSG